MNTWRIPVSLAAALLVVLLLAVRLDPRPPKSTPPEDRLDTTFHSIRLEAIAMAENGHLEDAIAIGTKALRIGEKSLGKDRLITPDVLDRWANTIESWYVALN